MVGSVLPDSDSDSDAGPADASLVVPATESDSPWVPELDSVPVLSSPQPVSPIAGTQTNAATTEYPRRRSSEFTLSRILNSPCQTLSVVEPLSLEQSFKTC